MGSLVLDAAFVAVSFLALTQSQAAAPSAAAGTAAPDGAVYFHKYYSGKIGDKYAFTMDLKNLNGKLNGTYKYVGKPAELRLQGSMDANGSFAIDEFSGFSTRTGVFKGTLTDKQIAGMWQSADGAKKWNFVADQTSEIKIGSKRDILTKAIGAYALDAISGSGGANTMWDTWKTKGKWASNVSSNSGGTRQGNAVVLTVADTQLLNSLMVTVDADLTTRLLARGKTVLSVPFRDNGMQFVLGNGHSSVVTNQLGKLSAGTTVLDEQLYLLLQDGVDFSSTIAGSFEATVGDIVVVSYAIIPDTFSVRFSEGQCCGGSEFTFKRSRRR